MESDAGEMVTVEYSKKYKSMTKAFMDTVLSGGKLRSVYLTSGIVIESFLKQIRRDSGTYWGALPWHADTLLQITEVLSSPRWCVQTV